MAVSATADESCGIPFLLAGDDKSLVRDELPRAPALEGLIHG